MLNKCLAKFVILSFIVALGLILLPVKHIARANDFTVTNTNDSGPGSLRQAIIDANSNPGPDTIKFAIQSGCGGYFTCTIYPDTPLPTLSGGGTTIDGSGSLQWIQIDGSKASFSHGFVITSRNNVIKWLAIKKFQGGQGVFISGSGATDNVISNNYIGTDAFSTANQGNDFNGIYIGDGAQNNTVEDNVISGNGENGIFINGSDTMNNTVSGNYIGTTANGTGALGNTGSGVSIMGGGNNTIGPDNVIAHNSTVGVIVAGSTGNTITQNSIYSNGMGINLPAGANGGIAAPVIVTTTTGSVNIIGTACPNCTVEVFQNSDNDGEGETYVENTTADASGAFTITVASLSKSYLTATATDAISGTSEFSAVFTATVPSAPGAGKVYLPIIIRN